jgi:hypothetical protein
MQSRPWWLAMMAAALLLSGTAAWADGDFYVVGNGSVGTRITYVPYIIEQPGFYFLTRNLTYSGGGEAILVNADNVTIDLMGFSLSGTTSSIGIDMSGRTNVEVRNGTVRGFSNGIMEAGDGSTHRVINIRAIDNQMGIDLRGDRHLIKSCTVLNNTQYGIDIYSGLIIDCVVSNNYRGINMNGPGTVLGNTCIDNSYTNFMFGLGSATAILVDRNSAFGRAPNYIVNSGTTGVVITANNAGTP